MTTVRVQVKQDHLERLVQRSTPIGAVAELIWNALDGDATKVEAAFEENDLGAITAVTVADNGHGIAHDEALQAFRDLGDSWKRRKRTSPGGRAFHGEKGQGRFTAFSIGSKVRWTTRWRDGEQTKKYAISGTDRDLQAFEVGDPEVVRDRQTGTQVEITGINRNLRSLQADDAPTRLAELFALYLLRYTEIRIMLNGSRVDPSEVEDYVEEYTIEDVTTESGEAVEAKLTIIEWKHKVTREMVLCDAAGCALASRKTGIHAKGFNFTAYLRSDFVRQHEGVLDLDELHPDLTRLTDAAKIIMRDHFRRRSADQAEKVVAQWKEEDVYPYKGLPGNPVEQAERQVFDVVALNVNEYLPDFATSDPRSKRFSFQMLKSAIEQSPSEVRRIVQEVLDLPQEKREELIELLDRTSLSSIINASKVVVNRLDFLMGLEVVLFDHEAKKRTKERKELHRLLAENTWVFGEEFNLAVDDQSLNEVLRKHLALLGRDPDDSAPPVTSPDGKQGIVDLMLSKQVRLPRGDEYEHLVVELKRPSKKIGAEVLQQVERYSFAVAGDERFKSSKVRWVFWALSNDMDEFAERKTRQSDRPLGQIFRSEDPNITIWARTWNQILDECKGRLRFFQDRLEYMASHEGGLEHLRTVYAKYLPGVLKTPGSETADG